MPQLFTLADLLRASQSVQTQSDDPELIAQIQQAIAAKLMGQWEARQQGHRDKRIAGRHERALRDGETGGRLCFGYRRVPGGVAIDPDAAATVRRIVALHDLGMTLRKIADDLNANSVSTGQHGKQWYASSVRAILHNSDLYRGGRRGDSDLMWPAILEQPPVAVAVIAAPPGAPTLTILPATMALDDARYADLDLAALGDFQPSPYQRRVFHFVLKEEGHGLIEAVAGSGKSTTLIQAAHLLRAAKLVKTPILFVAYNKHIERELNGKLDKKLGMARTVHSLGYGALMGWMRGAKPVQNDKKYEAICGEYVSRHIISIAGEAQRKVTDMLVQLVEFARVTLTNPLDHEALYAMIDHFGIDIEEADDPNDATREPSRLLPALLEALPLVLDRGAALAQDERTHMIDFTDMIWLPNRFDLRVKQADFVMADEAQDFSAAQRRLVFRACKPDGGRILFVGDRRQAIYGFTGADDQSFTEIQHEARATLMPLSVCYRCPTSHIDLARAIVPQIEPRPNAPVGHIITIKEEDMPQHVREGDLVICRLTAPLVSMCMTLIANDTFATVRGRDIGKQLINLITSVQRVRGYSWKQFGQWLAKYEDIQLDKLRQREGSENQQESLRDRVAAVRTIYEAKAHLSLVQALIEHINTLFSDERSPVELATIHRVKGDQRQRIFLMRPDKLPLVWQGQQPWEKTQEHNLRYVALTRSLDTLYFVTSKEQNEPATTEAEPLS